MRRCHRPKHRHSLPRAGQSPPPPLAPHPAPGVVFHEGCASENPRPAAWAVASAEACRRHWSVCGSELQIWPRHASPNLLSDKPTSARPPAGVPRAPPAAMDCTCRAAISVQWRSVSRDTKPGHPARRASRPVACGSRHLTPTAPRDRSQSRMCRQGPAICRAGGRVSFAPATPRGAPRPKLSLLRGRRRRLPPRRGTGRWPWLRLRETRRLRAASMLRVRAV
jgi:hypothetical protein